MSNVDDALPFPTPEEFRAMRQLPFSTPQEYNRSREWLIAVHESAHAIVRIHLTRTFPDSVCLNDNPSAGEYHGGRTQGSDIEDNDACGAIAAAGKVAEEIASGNHQPDVDLFVFHADPNDRDFFHIEAMAPPGPDGDAWMGGRYEAALACLHENWTEVEQLTRLLIHRRRLIGDDFRKFLNDSSQ